MTNKYSAFMGIGFGPGSTGVFSIGEFSSTGDNGFALSSSVTKALDVCADDGGTALTATSLRAIRGRMLVRTAIAGSPDLSVFGVQGHVKVGAVSVTNSARFAGLWGYFESISGSTLVGNFAGVYAMADVPSGATQTSGVIAGVEIASNSLGGTTSGSTACIHIPNPVAGTWDYFVQLGTASGAATANTHSIDSHALAFYLPAMFGSTAGYIPAFAAVPS
jgi:hypothetical protein